MHVAGDGLGTTLNLPGAMAQHVVRLRACPRDQAACGRRA